MAHDDQKFPERSGVSAFGSLAVEVLSVLNARQVGAQANQSGQDRTFVQSVLQRKLAARGIFNAAGMLRELRRLHLSDEDIIDHYIPQAARDVGQKWLSDEMGFAEVTIASARLQSLLTQIEFVSPNSHPTADSQFDMLVIATKREQHTLGCFVASAQLRRRGATVETLCGEPMQTLQDRIETGCYDAVLFSVSHLGDLEKINRLAIDSKKDMPHPPIFAVGGIILELAKGLGALDGIDLVTSDVETVLKACERRSIPTHIRASR